MAADVAALVAHLGVSPHLFGYSLGGAVALTLAAEQPALPRSVATFGFAAAFGRDSSTLVYALTSIVANVWCGLLYSSNRALKW